MSEPCKHVKVYSEYILCSYPPQHQWVCKICGEQGADVVGTYKANEYDEVVKKFKEVNDVQD